MVDCPRNRKKGILRETVSATPLDAGFKGNPLFTSKIAQPSSHKDEMLFRKRKQYAQILIKITPQIRHIK